MPLNMINLSIIIGYMYTCTYVVVVCSVYFHYAGRYTYTCTFTYIRTEYAMLMYIRIHVPYVVKMLTSEY